MADDGEQLGLAAEVTIAWLSNPHTRAAADDVSAMLGSVLSALRGLDGSSSASEPEPAPTEYKPAITARRSLASPDRIISMIDGKPYSSLKRHLRSRGLTPDEYRQRYGLKADYPMVAPGYSASRSAAAKQHQFGRKSAEADAAKQGADAAPETRREPAPEQATPTKRRRLGISAAKQAAKAHLGGGKERAAREPGAE